MPFNRGHAKCPRMSMWLLKLSVAFLTYPKDAWPQPQGLSGSGCTSGKLAMGGALSSTSHPDHVSGHPSELPQQDIPDEDGHPGADKQSSRKLRRNNLKRSCRLSGNNIFETDVCTSELRCEKRLQTWL